MEVVLEHREIGFRSGQALYGRVDRRGDVDGKPAGDGLGREHSAESWAVNSAAGLRHRRRPVAASACIEQIRVKACWLIDLGAARPVLRWNRCGRAGQKVVRACRSGQTRGTLPVLPSRNRLITVARTLASSGLISRRRSSLDFEGTICSRGTISPASGSGRRRRRAR